MSRRLWAVAGCVVTAAALIVWPVLRTKRLEKSFEAIQIGDPKEVVLRRMGSPWKDDQCGKFLGGKRAGCAEELVYAHPYAPTIPEYWLIDLDSKNRVQDAYYTTSP